MIRFVRKRIFIPIGKFIHDSRSVGVTLLACTALSLLLSNWGFWSDAYINFWTASFNGTASHTFNYGILSLPNSIELIVNDGFMAIFFFLVGMEIKREVVIGELSTLQKSALPVFCAIGGMLVPAMIYSFINRGTNELHGWAIPTATDIAFTLGVASLLGNRIPVSLKIFLTALAIIDDLIAILVIAFFYGGHLSFTYLLGCLFLVGLLWVLTKRKVKFGIFHWIIGLILWYCMFHSGIHATIAGVIFAFMVPKEKLNQLEMALHSPVHFFIMPLFALANTALIIPADSLSIFSSKISWGIMIGLCLGKPLGIFLAAYFMVTKKLAELPRGVNWHKLIGAGLLAGIGFTMSIFITMLAFSDATHRDIGKISVLIASLFAMIFSAIWFISEDFKKKKASN